MSAFAGQLRAECTLLLRDKGVLKTRKDANRVYYRVGDVRVLQLIGMMREVFCATPDPM